MTWPENGVATLMAVALLVAIAVAVLFAARVPQRWAPAWAVFRGALQLAAISIVLTGVISDARWVALALVVMFVVASSAAIVGYGLAPRLVPSGRDARRSAAGPGAARSADPR